MTVGFKHSLMCFKKFKKLLCFSKCLKMKLFFLIYILLKNVDNQFTLANLKSSFQKFFNKNKIIV